MSKDEFINNITNKFLYAERLAEQIWVAKESLQPILWWGPGGHGKTAIAEFGAKLLYPPEEIGIKNFGHGTLAGSIFGGLDFHSLQTKGDLRYFIEESPFGQQVFIMEELLDAPASLIEFFKYAMMSGKFPNGRKELFPIRTELYIASTNREPRVWADMDEETKVSKRALLGRFPITLEVKWPRYDHADFTELLKRVFGAEVCKKYLSAVPAAVVLCYENKVRLSPRDVVKIAERNIAQQSDSIDEFFNNEQVQYNPALCNELRLRTKTLKESALYEEQLSSIAANLKKLPKPSSDIQKNNKCIGVLSMYEQKILLMRPTDALVPKVNAGLRTLRELKEKYNEANIASVTLTPSEVLEWKV